MMEDPAVCGCDPGESCILCERELPNEPRRRLNESRAEFEVQLIQSRAHTAEWCRKLGALRKPHQPFCNVRAPDHFVRVDDDPPEGECDCDSKGWNDALDASIALSSPSPEEGT